MFSTLEFQILPNTEMDISVFDNGIPNFCLTQNSAPKTSTITHGDIPCELEELSLRMRLSHHKSFHSAEVSQTWSADFSGGISTSSNTAACLLMRYKMNRVPERFSHHHLVDHVHYFSNPKPADESPVQSSSCWRSISKCIILYTKTELFIQLYIIIILCKSILKNDTLMTATDH